MTSDATSKPGPEKANVVILASGQIPELLSHIEAGRITLVITARLPPGEDES